ncbi:MAG: hypothetical protein Q9166_006821 [cf. Caloplaca sp. 2 TL-2023]
MFRSSKGVDVDTSNGQNHTGYGFGLAWSPLTIHDAQLAAAAFNGDYVLAQRPEFERPSVNPDQYALTTQQQELASPPISLDKYVMSTQRRELGSPPTSLDNFTIATQRQELESPLSPDRYAMSTQCQELASPPYSHPSELQGDQHTTVWTPEPHQRAELSSVDDANRHSLKPKGSAASDADIPQAWPTYAQSVSSPDTTQLSAFIARFPLLDQTPQFELPTSAVLQSGLPPQRLRTGLSRYTLPGYGGPNSALPMNMLATQQPSPFDQFQDQSSQVSHFAPVHSDINHRQGCGTTETHWTPISTHRKTVDWPLDRLVQSHPSVNPGTTVERDLRYPNPVYNPTMIMPGLHNESLFSQRGRQLATSCYDPEPYDAQEQTIYPQSSVPEEAYRAMTSQRQDSPISPLASPTNVISPSEISPLSSPGSHETSRTHDRRRPVPLVIPMGLPNFFDSLLSTNTSSAESSKMSTTTQSIPTEASSDSAGTPSSFSMTVPPQPCKARGVLHCPKCPPESPTAFHGSLQDRRSNLKRHLKYCHGKQEPSRCPQKGCNNGYSRPDGLTKHLQSKHKDVPSLQRSNAHKVRRDF